MSADNHYKMDDMHKDMHKPTKPTLTTVGFDHLVTSMEHLELSGTLNKEYAKLPAPCMFPCRVGKAEKSSKKNRWKDIIPFDHNRVILCPQSVNMMDSRGELGDYINASFIRGYSNNDGYIATQGPMLGTVEDFWSMVWSENSRLVVMMCRLVERFQNQSYKYWPEVGECLDVDDVIIRTDVEDDRGTHVVRKIILRHVKSGEQRDVIHLQFLAWPDNSLPCLPTFVTFWKTFRKFQCPSAGPPIIHCSNGSQRTGLLIALDSLISQWEVTSSVDVLSCVVRMREDRVGFFPFQSDYLFLYQAAVEAYLSLMTHQSDDQRGEGQGQAKYGRLQGQQSRDVVSEYSLLDMRRPKQNCVQKPVCCLDNGNMVSSDEINEQSFQSFQIQFPCDTGSVFVTSVPLCHQTLKKQNVECPIRLRHSVSLQEHEVFLGIGGVLPSDCKCSFLVTPSPTSTQTVDFWRMMFETGCQCVVRLMSWEQAANLQPDRMPLQTSDFHLSVTSQTHLRDLVTETNMSLRTTTPSVTPIDSDNPPELPIKVYTLAWSHDQTLSPTFDVLYFLYKLISNFLMETSTTLVAVQCCDGWSTSGHFCAAYNILSSLVTDDRVNVYLWSRTVQSRLPRAISQAEYKHLYKVCDDYRRQKHHYLQLNNVNYH